MLKRVKKIKIIPILLAGSLILSGTVYGMGKDEYSFKKVEKNKTWKIEFHGNIDPHEIISTQASLYNEEGKKVKSLPFSMGDKNNILLIEAPADGYETGEEYQIKIPGDLKSATGETLGEDKYINFTVEDGYVAKLPENYKIEYQDYGMTLQQFSKIEYENELATISTKGYGNRNATFEEVKYYLNPENFMDEYGIFQFLSLNYQECLTVDEVNELLKGKGILEGKGALLLEGAKMYDVNPAYLVAHTILETGNGKVSRLANGIKVTYVDGEKVDSRVTYNVFGIGAKDTDPDRLGSEYAYKQGWFTPEIAILEGVGWISSRYINNPQYNQNTLYKMKWNKDETWHQYSSDVEWPYKQIKRIKDYINEDAELLFEIPKFQK